MGPVDPMKTEAAKLFASSYSIFSGCVLFTAISFVLASLFHRLLRTGFTWTTRTSEGSRVTGHDGGDRVQKSVSASFRSSSWIQALR